MTASLHGKKATNYVACTDLTQDQMVVDTDHR